VCFHELPLAPAGAAAELGLVIIISRPHKRLTTGMAELEIKNKEPRFRLMVQEYAQMCSGFYLRMLLAWLGIDAVGLAIYSFVPSTNGFFETLHFVNAYLLIPGNCMMLFGLLSPLLTRVVFPLVIVALEVMRLLLLVVQSLIDVLLITEITKSFIYPVDQADEKLTHEG
jgi:hypothetical protein